MKTERIINTYCRIYGVKSPKIEVTTKEYFVTISADGSGVLSICKPSVLLGRIVGSALKRGAVLYVKNDLVTSITWSNWREIWSKLFTTKVRKTAPEPNVLRPYKSEMFETMQQKGARKKPAKRGFERTFKSNTAMNLLGLPTIKRQRIS